MTGLPRLRKVSLLKRFGVFLYIGATSFGGGVIAYLQEHLVSRQNWLDGWQDWVILIPAFVLVGIFYISLVPVLVVLASIAIQLNRPDRKELAAYHAQQAAYHAQLAEHHEEVAARHGAVDAVRGHRHE